MTIYTSYSVKIKKDDGDPIACYRVFEDTVERYRQAVDFFLCVRLKEQHAFSKLTTAFDQLRLMEQMTISTKTTRSRNTISEHRFTSFLLITVGRPSMKRSGRQTPI